MSKSALVIGFAISGKAVIKLLKDKGYNVVLTDNNILSEDIKTELVDVEVFDGGHPLSLLDKDYDFIIKNPGIPYHVPFINAIIEKKLPIYTEIEIAYLFSNDNIIAITGTNGKTTTTTMLCDILSLSLENLYCGGNIGVPYSEIALNRTVNKNVVLELSNFQLLGTSKFKPHIATITNLAPDHLDYMNSIEEYYESKLLIFRNQTIDDYFLLNVDDELLVEYVSKSEIKATIITYSYYSDKACVYIENNFVYYNDEKILELSKLKVVGKHNVYNVMVCVAISRLLGVEGSLIRKGLYNFNGVEYRLQKVDGFKNNNYYNDSKSTSPQSTITAIESFEDCEIILIIGGKDKGLSFETLSNRINELDNVKLILTFGELSFKLKGLFRPKTFTFKTLVDVIDFIEEKIDNEIIVFSPGSSSYDQFKNYEERGLVFNNLIGGVK